MSGEERPGPPQLSAARVQLEQALVQQRSLWDAPDEQLARAPRQGGWSAVQCLEHLARTSEAYLPLLDAALQAAPAATHSAPVALGWQARLLLWTLEPPYRLRVKTKPGFVPAEGLPPPQAVGERFQRLQQALLERLESARGVALERTRVVSPFARGVSYNLAATFLVLAAHQRRHLWQARRALED